MYINTETLEYPLSRMDVILQFPNTSFAGDFENFKGFAKVGLIDTPEFDPVIQKAVEQAPVEIDGVWTQQWNVVALTEDEIIARRPTRNQLKAARAAAVESITIEVNGKIFDGDETSQERMSRALTVASITGLTSCTWVLHDNSAVTVTKEELAEALALSMQAQAAVWLLP